MPFYKVFFEEKIQYEVTVEAASETAALAAANEELLSEDVEVTVVEFVPVLVQDEETF
jgi:hypothetical protein